MDTRGEEFALMRRAFLRAALEEAEEAGSGSASRVQLERVAGRLGADLCGEAKAALMVRYREMARHYLELEDLADLDVHGGSFRITKQGIAAARTEEG